MGRQWATYHPAYIRYDSVGGHAIGKATACWASGLALDRSFQAAFLYERERGVCCNCITIQFSLMFVSTSISVAFVPAVLHFDVARF